MKRVIKKELTEKEYSHFIKKILAINEKEGHLPEYIEYDDCRIYKIEYIETIENVNKFILENGRHPETVNIYLQKHNRNN
ncbi:MAG: pseudomurein-binding protein [Methanosphaera sp.]|nr:pseudomurein-binding protein [Methanosphaera sp.]